MRFVTRICDECFVMNVKYTRSYLKIIIVMKLTRTGSTPVLLVGSAATSKTRCLPTSKIASSNESVL